MFEQQQHEQVARRLGGVARSLAPAPPKPSPQLAEEPHPLDPLSATELEAASSAVLEHAAGLGITPAALRFNTVSLQARALGPGCGWWPSGRGAQGQPRCVKSRAGASGSPGCSGRAACNPMQPPRTAPLARHPSHPRRAALG